MLAYTCISSHVHIVMYNFLSLMTHVWPNNELNYFSSHIVIHFLLKKESRLYPFYLFYAFFNCIVSQRTEEYLTRGVWLINYTTKILHSITKCTLTYFKVNCEISFTRFCYHYNIWKLERIGVKILIRNWHYFFSS